MFFMNTISNDACVKPLVELLNPPYAVCVGVAPCSRILKRKKHSFLANFGGNVSRYEICIGGIGVLF